MSEVRASEVAERKEAHGRRSGDERLASSRTIGGRLEGTGGGSD